MGARGSLSAWISLLHPAPVAVVLLAAFGFSVTAAGGKPPPRRLLPLLGALLFTQLSISLHNDYCDRALDARVKPWRAIPRGLVSPALVLTTSLALYLLGLLVATPLGPLNTSLLALASAAGLAYNAWFKRSAWTWVPYAVALPTVPVCAFVAMRRFEPRLLLTYLVGLPLVLAVYLADTLSDVDLDRSAGVRGLAHRLGPEGAARVCWLSLLAGLVLAVMTTRRQARHPAYAVALASLGLTPILPRRHGRDPHWLAVMATVVSIAIAWLPDQR